MLRKQCIDLRSREGGKALKDDLMLVCVDDEGWSERSSDIARRRSNKRKGNRSNVFAASISSEKELRFALSVGEKVVYLRFCSLSPKLWSLSYTENRYISN